MEGKLETLTELLSGLSFNHSNFGGTYFKKQERGSSITEQQKDRPAAFAFGIGRARVRP